MKDFILKRLIGIITLVLCLSSAALGQQKVFFEQLPVPSGVQPSIDPSIPKISWNRWTTKNFVIHSIDFDQGEYLFNNIEHMKDWCFSRWGLPDIHFGAECRIFCAPNVETMKKLFNLERSVGEVRIDKDGKLVISYLWLVLDGRPTEVIPPALTMVCLKEFNNQRYLNLGWWIYRGMSVLNESTNQIKINVMLAGRTKSPFNIKTLFSTTEVEWKKFSQADKQLFDAKAAMMCLMIRKEYGQKHFLYFLKFDNYEKDIKDYMGFDGFEKLNETFSRFVFNLANDVERNTTPDSYLHIEAIKQGG